MATVLTLDGALAGCSAAVVRDGAVIAVRQARGGRGQAVALPEMARAVLAEAGVPAAALDRVAVTTGPGSFTGVRAALALAHGIALGAGVAVTGVPVPAAMQRSAVPGRALWVALDNRRGRVFLHRDGALATVELDSLPKPDGPVAVAGDAAAAVVERLVAAGHDALLLAVGEPDPAGIAAAALAAPEQPAQPLYVDAPEARPGPASRPAPA